LAIVKVIVTFGLPTIFLIALILSYVHKLAGVEFVHVYLLMIYLFIIQNKLTLFKSVLQLFSYLDIRFLSFIVDYDDPNTNSQLIDCLFTSFIYYAIVVSVFILRLILRFFREKLSKDKNLKIL